jgi:hypothetical protein
MVACRKDDYMKKYKLLITLVVCLCMFCTDGIGSVKSDASDADGLIFTYDNVIKIDISAGGPTDLDYQKYNYSTSLRNEIEYILNYINNFHLEDDGAILYPNDASSYSVKIYITDGSMKECGFYAGRFYDDSDKQYDIDVNEYDRFLNFINALKTKKIILDDEVTFEPSEWAKSDIDKAVERELVPKLNQINYKGKINRLEVCQLIDNLLDKQNVAKPESTKNPFSDTADKSVISLYNHGIIDGKNESEFDPYGYVTREELSKILSNTYYLINPKVQSDNGTHEYADRDKISHWALNYVDDMYSLNIMIGNTENEFKPQDNVTKEELIITLLRIYDSMSTVGVETK